MRALLLAVASMFAAGLLLLSCEKQPGQSQITYSYPGCERAALTCPNDVTLYCALADVLAKYDDCTADTDCDFSELADSCVPVNTCDGPPAVNRAKKDAFLAAANAELDRYCAVPNCNAVPACGTGPRRNVVVCADGHCRRAFHPLDAGDDAGLPDGGDAGDGG